MKKRYFQTKKWEKDYLKTRRYMLLRKRRLESFSFEKGSNILDLGCGDGLNIKIMRDLSLKKITGVDISRFLLKKAKKLNPSAKFILAPAEKLPFKSGTFDAVLVDSVFFKESAKLFL